MKSLTLTLALVASTLSLSTLTWAQTEVSDTDLPSMIVYKNPSCGCCSLWVDHVKEYGFKAKTYTSNKMDKLKDRLGVPAKLRSCHVATVDGYTFEGHVPADLIEKVLTERPEIAGLTVPGMVVGSPGMEGRNPQHYDVLAFTVSGETYVYAKR